MRNMNTRGGGGDTGGDPSVNIRLDDPVRGNDADDVFSGTKKPGGSSGEGAAQRKGHLKRKQVERPLANYRMRTQDNFFDGRLMNILEVHEDAFVSPESNMLFMVQVIELLFVLSLFIVGLLVVTERVSINHYIVVIAVGIITVILVFLHFFNLSRWVHQSDFAHTHNNTIFTSFFYWLIVLILFEVMLGMWLLDKPNSECCTKGDSQPDQFPEANQEYTEFLVIYGFIVGSSILVAAHLMSALISHYYPVKRYIPPYFFPDVVEHTSQYASTSGGEVRRNG